MSSFNPGKNVNTLINEELSSFHTAALTYGAQENVHELIIIIRDTRPQHPTGGGAHAGGAPSFNAALLSR